MRSNCHADTFICLLPLVLFLWIAQWMRDWQQNQECLAVFWWHWTARTLCANIATGEKSTIAKHTNKEQFKRKIDAKIFFHCIYISYSQGIYINAFTIFDVFRVPIPRIMMMTTTMTMTMMIKIMMMVWMRARFLASATSLVTISQNGIMLPTTVAMVNGI